MMNKTKIGKIIKTTDFNEKLFIEEKIISRNTNEIKLKFINKNIFQKIVNNLFIETNYRQGSIQNNFFSFSSIVSPNVPAIFYFFTPNLQNIKCKIDVNITPAPYFSKIASQNIFNTITTLTQISESNSNNNNVSVSTNYNPATTTTPAWQGEGWSNIVEPQIINNIPSSVWREEGAKYGHFHFYKMAGEMSTTIFDYINVYHTHYFKLGDHNHDIFFENHNHNFSPHTHDFITYSHNHQINLYHKHTLENNIYFLNKKGNLSKILLNNSNYINKTEININPNTKNIIKVYINENISKVQCNILITGNYL